MPSATPKGIKATLEAFAKDAQPLEDSKSLHLLTDKITGAQFCDCHVRASLLVALGTIDVPLDPDEQGEYRANREILQDHGAFAKMKDDARGGRLFSNLVVEYTMEFDPDHPLKIIGGQHRFEAIRMALENNKVDEYHGVKVYLELTRAQRLDAQLISNTNLAVSPDLLDRMQETMRGPELRDWCHEVGLLPKGTDFTDKHQRGGPISVQMARMFILNYCRGRDASSKDFEKTETTPFVPTRGEDDSEWDHLAAKGAIWKDKELKNAAEEFVALMKAQRKWFGGKKGVRRDRPEKALNIAVMSAWAFVAGLFHKNPVRLQRHFDLRKQSTRDPLNASALDKGRHKTDLDNYRGMGFRTDPKERGRFVELFHAQTERGDGITQGIVNVAIAKYHAKHATLEAILATTALSNDGN
jgi:hypothetical protein